MWKRISTVALLLSSFVIGCQGTKDDNNGANGNAPQNASGGDAGTGGTPAVRAAQPKPIEAVFSQEKFTTDYSTAITNPDRDELIFAWSGPHCGFFAADKTTCSDASCTAKYTWNHASPPCPEHSHHDDTTILLQVIGKRSGKELICIYKGAASGTGPTCYQNGFNGTELGIAQPNSAFVRYHLPLGKQCSKVDLIQVMSIVHKSSGRTVVPHNQGIEESEPNMYGYQPPLAADDMDGYVVDKFFYEDIGTNDPYYQGSVPGSPTKDAELDDRPENVRDGHLARFEVCAFCSGNPSDAEYGNYLGCLTYEYDADTGNVKKTDPQPTQAPTPGFTGAVDQWNKNKSFTMPKK